MRTSRIASQRDLKVRTAIIALRKQASTGSEENLRREPGWQSARHDIRVGQPTELLQYFTATASVAVCSVLRIRTPGRLFEAHKAKLRPSRIFCNARPHCVKHASRPRTPCGRAHRRGLRAAAPQHPGRRQDVGVVEEGRCRDPGVARSVSASVDTLRLLRRGRRERITVSSTQSRRRTPGSASFPTKWASASSSARAPSASP